MIFGVADIHDGDIRRGRRVIDGAAQPVRDLPVAAARPRGKPLAENFGRRRDRDHDDVGIGAAHRLDDRTRYIGDHRAPGADARRRSRGASA